MLLYEEGGHFKKHRDTEKEPGMFGSLLVQLPADHEGGHLVVEHDTQKKRYQFDKDSADKAYYAAFYADCEHTLEPVTKGLRLVLAFNLVRGGTNSAPVKSVATAAHRRKFEDVLYTAAKAWCADPSGVQKLALPLAHQYTHTNVSFNGLKGTDLSTLHLLQNICDPKTNEKVFRVYLALVTKHETGTEDECDYRYGYGGGGEMIDKEVEYETESWVGPAGMVNFGELSVDFEEELLVAPGSKYEDATTEMFGTDPVDEERDGYCGNEAGTIEYWYHSAVLVFWPAEKDFDIKLAANPDQAVALLQNLKPTSPDFDLKLNRLLAFLGSDKAEAWRPAEVIPLAKTVEQVRTTFVLCHKLRITQTDAMAVVKAVIKHGWTPLQDDIRNLVSSQVPANMAMLLDLLHQHCVLSGASSVTARVLVPKNAWQNLLIVMSAKTCKANFASAAPGYLIRGSSAPPSAYQSTLADEECLKVSRFVIKHCAPNEQVAVAAHLGSQLRLPSLNNLLQQLQSATGEALTDGPFQAELRSCAVQQCIDKVQAAGDMTAVVDWVVRGQYADLLVRLHATLKRLCNDPALFRALFALPSVRKELMSETSLSAELESHVQARINVVTPQSIAPPFSWRMAANQIAHNDPRIGKFLASDFQSTTITGEWSSIVQARNWGQRLYCFGNASIRPVTAVAFGSGRSAGVVLTKDKSVHDAAVKRCAENEVELQTLRKLLKVRGACAVSGGEAGIGGSNGGSSSEAPPAKKLRAETEVIVIDD